MSDLLESLKAEIIRLSRKEIKAAITPLHTSNIKLKKWYLSQGFIETGSKDFEHLPFRVCFMNKQI